MLTTVCFVDFWLCNLPGSGGASVIDSLDPIVGKPVVAKHDLGLTVFISLLKNVSKAIFIPW